MKKTAFLIIDLQHDFCADDGAMGQLGKDVKDIQQAAAVVEKLMSSPAAEDWFTIWIETHHQLETTPDVWNARSEGAATICTTETGRAPFIQAKEQADAVVVKNRYNAFLYTNLELLLRTAGVERVLIAGCTTNVCVESTARHAFMLDFETITLTDATAAYDRREHKHALQNLHKYFGSVSSTISVETEFLSSKYK